jgi:hypothetical protein
VANAIFGLVGVLVGGLIAAAAPYWMARRTEKIKARTSARLLQDDLRIVLSRLRVHASALEAKKSGEASEIERMMMGRLDPQATGAALYESLKLDSWLEHRPLLAETLDGKDWNSLSSAYQWIEDAQRKFAARAEAVAEPFRPGRVRVRPRIDERFVRRGLDELSAGLSALDRLAR